MVIPKFVGQALRNEPITVYGDGTQTRTFTHVREVVRALLALVETPKAVGQVFNIGGVQEVSMLELAHRIRALADSQSPIELVPYDVAYPKDFEDMQRRVPSTRKLRETVGFAPELGLDAILQDVLEAARAAMTASERRDAAFNDAIREAPSRGADHPAPGFYL